MIEAPTVPDNESYVVVRITNKTDFDFTPAMGARYGGQPFFIPAGKSLLAPKPVANYLARNLARQVFIKNAPIRDEKETDGKGTDRALWTSEDIDRVKVKFLSDEYEEERVAPKTEAEIMASRIKELNKDFDLNPPTSTEVTSNQATTFADKAEVINALKAKNIKFDARQSKANLEKLLK